MKSRAILNFSIFILTAVTLLGTYPTAKAAPTAAQQAQIDELKKTYTLTTCPVSGDKLDSADMGGKPVDYLYMKKNADGTETTRLVRFCCKDCLVKFKKNPDKFLKVIDEAQVKPAASATPSTTK